MFAVTADAEFRRIQALPSLYLTKEDKQRLIKELSPRYRTPAGEAAGVELLEDQAASLYKLERSKGLVGYIAVGSGKTLTGFLAAMVLGASRPCLVVPGNLKHHKTPLEMDAYAEHWRFVPPVLVSYQELGKPNNRELLLDVRPDLLILDECFMAKNESAAVTHRLGEFCTAHPEVPVVVLGASAMTRSLLQLTHLSEWALGEQSPLPLTSAKGKHTLTQWHLAVSEGVPDRKRVGVGSLRRLAPVDVKEIAAVREYDPDSPADIIEARLAIRKKLNNSPGFVISAGERPATSLNLFGAYPDVSVMAEHFERLRTDAIAIDDYKYENPMLLWQLARQVALGFEYVWRPRPPEEWLNARRAWANYVRDVIRYRRRRYDAPGVVKAAVISGELPQGRDILTEWQRVEPTFEINQEAVWVSDVMVDWVANWANRRENKNALIWSDVDAFSRRLSKKTGIKFFAQGGLCADLPIEQHKGPAILSVGANYLGRNLQSRWSRNLIVSMPPTGLHVEQLLGRTHRRGQEADVVEATFVMACKEHLRGWEAMLRDARYTKTTSGLDQRILYATVDVVDSGLSESLL